MRFWLWSSLLLGALLAPRAAQAWTDAHVREAQATLQLDVPAQRVAVTLDLAVDVRGGWLERLDLTGLDEGLTPEPADAAYALLEGGEQVPAKLSLHAGLASVRFQRRDGLRRGVHHVVLRYSAPLAQIERREGDAQRVAWTLPGWESGLTRGVIEVRGAGPLRPVVDAELAQEVAESRDTGEPTLRFSRIHVPRASPWTIAVDVDPTARRTLRAGESALALSAAGPQLRTGAWLAFALCALVLLRRAVLRRTRTWLGPWGVLALGALGAVLWGYALPLALLCWSGMSWSALWPRTAAQRPLPLGRVLPLHARERSRLRRSALRAWIGLPLGEVASVFGALELSAMVALLVVWEPALDASDPWGLGLLCGLFAALAGSRFWSARDSAEQVGLLLRAAERTRMVACGLSLCAYVADGKPYHPRLRLWPGVRYPGLSRLEVLVHAQRAASPLWLSVEVEPGSAAARWIAELWPDLVVAQDGQGQRLSLRRSIEDIGAAAEQLLEHLSRESQRCLLERAPAQAA